MERPIMSCESDDLNLKATELRLGLPGTDPAPDKQSSHKRALSEIDRDSDAKNGDQQRRAPPAKGQVVGWPPVRSYRKHCLQQKKSEANGSGMYVKVRMDGAPYLRKIDLNLVARRRGGGGGGSGDT